MTQQEPSYTKPTHTEPESLEEQLERLEQNLASAKDAQTAASSDVTDLEGRIAALNTLQKDIDKAEADYQEAYQRLVDDQQSCCEYYDYETKCLTEIVGAAKTTIEHAVSDAETELAEATTAVDDARSALADLEAQLAEADSLRQAAGTDADELKNLVATVDARLAELDSIKTGVNEAHEDTDYALAYWLLVMGDFSSILEREPQLIDPADLPDALLAAVNELSDAEEAYASKELELGQQQAVLVDVEAHLETVTKEYDEKLRDALKDIRPAQPSYSTTQTQSAETATDTGTL